MHKARTAIVDALAALDLPGTSVEPYARNAIIDGPTLLVRVDRARPDTTAPPRVAAVRGGRNPRRSRGGAGSGRRRYRRPT